MIQTMNIDEQLHADFIIQELQETCPEYHGEVIRFVLTDSTNRTAKEYAMRGRECLVIADRQNGGRGRYNRTFDSAEGGLYMSLCLKVDKERLEKIAKEGSPEDDATFAVGERLLQYPVQTGEAVAKALGTLYDEKFEIKLPNDVLLNQKKVVGILIEAIHRDESIYLIFGVGVNLENPLPKELDQAANLLDLTGKSIPREKVCAQIVHEIINIL